MKTRRCLEIKRARKNNEKETRMLEWYWKEVGGTLCAEFSVATATQRRLDAVILPEGEYKEVNTDQMKKLLNGNAAIVVQAKADRLSMALMGQALFSPALVKREFKPRSIRSVALCRENHPNLESLLKSTALKSAAKKIGAGIPTVVKVPECFEESKWHRRGSRERSMICGWNKTKDKGKLFDNFQRASRDSSTDIPKFGALILSDEPKEWIHWKDISTAHKAIYKSLRNRDVTVVHAEHDYASIGMSLMGEALFSAMLVKKHFHPRSVRSVALCKKDDCILSSMLKDTGKKIGIDTKAVVVPQDVNAQSKL